MTKHELFDQIAEEHNKWVLDTCYRFEDAGLNPPDAAAAMTTVLMHAIAAIWVAGNEDEIGKIDELGHVLKRMVKNRMKDMRKFRRTQKNAN